MRSEVAHFLSETREANVGVKGERRKADLGGYRAKSLLRAASVAVRLNELSGSEFSYVCNETNWGETRKYGKHTVYVSARKHVTLVFMLHKQNTGVNY